MYFFYFMFFRADSVTWNPHKLMGTLLQCSTIHFKIDVSDMHIRVRPTKNIGGAVGAWKNLLGYL